MPRFQGKVVLVTGASGGIGSAVSTSLVAEGAKVALFARTPERLDALKDQLGDAAVAIPGDALRFEDLDRAVATATERFGHLDGLAHCVGGLLLKPLHMTREDEWAQQIALNLTSAFLAMKAVLPTMLAARSGSIVCVSSVVATSGLVNHEAMAAAKGGLAAMVRSAAITYARQGIRVNAVAPSLVRTPLSARIHASPTGLAASERLHPIGRIGEPADVAAAMLYLLSDQASWVTGVVLPVDGGMAAGRSPAPPT